MNLAATHDIRIRSIGQENDDELGWKRNGSKRNECKYKQFVFVVNVNKGPVGAFDANPDSC